MSSLVPSWVHAVDSARKLVGPVRLTATRASDGRNASSPTVASSGTVETLTVSPVGRGPVAPLPPICPSPHPAASAAAPATASVLLARNARRLRQSSQLMVYRGGGRVANGLRAASRRHAATARDRCLPDTACPRRRPPRCRRAAPRSDPCCASHVPR